MALATALSSSGTGATAGTFDSDFRLQTVAGLKISGSFRYPLGYSWCGVSSPPLPTKVQSMGTIKSFNFNLRNLHMVSAGGKDVEDSSLWDSKEDSEEMYDDLFKRYGKVVCTRGVTKSLLLQRLMMQKAYHLRSRWQRLQVTQKQLILRSKIRDLAEKTYGRIPTGNSKPNSWTLLDYGDVVVHIFLPQQRDFYNLEEFYGNATLVDLPFENQPPYGA